MEALYLKIVGNGGCINAGLPYHAFLMNKTFLVESPPDVMVSLKALAIDIRRIETVFVSHLHGDHTFGLPFLIIEKWFISHCAKDVSELIIFGPTGIEQYALTLMESAFTSAHPSYEWMKRNVRFISVNDTVPISWNSLTITPIKLKHLIETHGFMIHAPHTSVPLFAYIADTLWCQEVEQVLACKPHVVFIDMNGGGVHISLDEVLEKGLPLTKGDTTYYGMHLAQEFESDEPCLRCGKQGEIIDAGRIKR